MDRSWHQLLLKHQILDIHPCYFSALIYLSALFLYNYKPFSGASFLVSRKQCVLRTPGPICLLSPSLSHWTVIVERGKFPSLVLIPHCVLNMKVPGNHERVDLAFLLREVDRWGEV